MMLCVGVIDYVTGWELDVGILYLVPVAVVSWTMGHRLGYVLAVLSAALTLLAEILGGKPYSHPAMPLWNAAVDAITLGVIARTLSALRGALAHEYEAARTDGLTGIPNRKGFMEVLVRELERARRHGHPLSFAYIDCDEFKSVNDRFGHEVGDRFLQAVARAMKATVRQVDAIARLGGDEFGVLLPETSADEALRMTERLLGALEVAPEVLQAGASVSVGVVTFPKPPPSVDDMIREADLLMYGVKQTGKRGVRHAVVGEGTDSPAL